MTSVEEPSIILRVRYIVVEVVMSVGSIAILVIIAVKSFIDMMNGSRGSAHRWEGLIIVEAINLLVIICDDRWEDSLEVRFKLEEHLGSH